MPRRDASAASTVGKALEAQDRVLGFHSVAYGPTLRLGMGSMLGMKGQVASIHEQFHQSLTESTTYGALMLTSSLLGAVFPEHIWLGRTLHQLARRCRTVQEARATFSSIWLAADGDLSLLAGSHEYQNWYRDGAEAVPLPDHSRLKTISLGAMASVCMCPPVLERFSSWNILDERDWRILPAEYPDRRFAEFHRKVNDPVWYSILDQVRELLGSKTWDLFVPRAPNPDLLTETFNEEYYAAVGAVSDVMLTRMAEILSGAGYETQFSTDSTYSSLLDRLRSYIPWVDEVMSMDTSKTPIEELVASAYSERILLSDHPRHARVRDLRADLLGNRVALPIFGYEGYSPFLFLAIRSGRRLLQQYVFEQGEEDWLRDHLDEQVAYLLGRSADPDFDWDLFIAKDASCLTELARGVKGKLLIHLNRSLGATARYLSHQATEAALQAADSCSALVDFPVLAAVKGWMMNEVPIRYAWGTLSHSDVERVHFIACRLDTDSLFEETALILCGTLQVRSLMEYLDDYGAEFDQTILSAEGSLMPVIPHIIVTSEHIMDYRTSFRKEFQ
jgi:hypothetical protein